LIFSDPLERPGIKPQSKPGLNTTKRNITFSWAKTADCPSTGRCCLIVVGVFRDFDCLFVDTSKRRRPWTSEQALSQKTEEIIINHSHYQQAHKMSNVLHVVCFDERRYTITDTKLGEGSQGTILSGKDEDNNCVAIKIVRFSSPKAQAQFQYEKFITNKIMEANDDTSGLCVFLGVQEQQEWGIMVMNQYETDLFNFLFEINFQPKLNETPAKSGLKTGKYFV